MFCIKCSTKDTRVTNSRPRKKTAEIWRRRHCPSCGYTFTTLEKPAPDNMLHVLSPDGTIAAYLPGKHIESIMRSFLHDPIAGQASALALSETILLSLSKPKGKPVTPTELAEATYVVLSRFDAAAAAQYGIAQGVLAAPTLRRKATR